MRIEGSFTDFNRTFLVYRGQDGENQAIGAGIPGRMKERADVFIS